MLSVDTARSTKGIADDRILRFLTGHRAQCFRHSDRIFFFWIWRGSSKIHFPTASQAHLPYCLKEYFRSVEHDYHINPGSPESISSNGAVIVLGPRDRCYEIKASRRTGQFCLHLWRIHSAKNGTTRDYCDFFNRGPRRPGFNCCWFRIERSV